MYPISSVLHIKGSLVLNYTGRIPMLDGAASCPLKQARLINDQCGEALLHVNVTLAYNPSS